MANILSYIAVGILSVVTGFLLRGRRKPKTETLFSSAASHPKLGSPVPATQVERDARWEANKRHADFHAMQLRLYEGPGEGGKAKFISLEAKTEENAFVKMRVYRNGRLIAIVRLALFSDENSLPLELQVGKKRTPYKADAEGFAAVEQAIRRLIDKPAPTAA